MAGKGRANRKFGRKEGHLWKTIKIEIEQL